MTTRQPTGPTQNLVQQVDGILKGQCIAGCGLQAVPGDVFCEGDREAYNRDPSFILDAPELVTE